MEQVKGTPETQGRIITAYRETRSDPDLAEQLLMAVGVGGTTSTSTIYENYLDGLHVSNLDPGEYWKLIATVSSFIRNDDFII